MERDYFTKSLLNRLFTWSEVIIGFGNGDFKINAKVCFSKCTFVKKTQKNVSKLITRNSGVTNSKKSVLMEYEYPTVELE